MMKENQELKSTFCTRTDSALDRQHSLHHPTLWPFLWLNPVNRLFGFFIRIFYKTRAILYIVIFSL